MKRVVVALALCLIASDAPAHGSVTARIERTTRAIHAHPNEAALYAERGALHALDHNWTQAAADFEEARDIDPSLDGIDLSLATALLELAEHERVVSLLDAALARAPSPDGSVVRARALVALGEPERAASDYTRAIALSAAPSPRLYRERAQALAAAAHVEPALASLREGIERLGPIVSLIEPAIDLELSRGRHDAALALLDRLEPALRQSPRWQARRGDILALAGHHQRADAAYRDALDGIARHPRASRALDDLRTEVERARATLPTPATPPRRWPWWVAAAAVAAAAALFHRRLRVRPASGGRESPR